MTGTRYEFNGYFQINEGLKGTLQMFLQGENGGHEGIQMVNKEILLKMCIRI